MWSNVDFIAVEFGGTRKAANDGFFVDEDRLDVCAGDEFVRCGEASWAGADDDGFSGHFVCDLGVSTRRLALWCVNGNGDTGQIIKNRGKNQLFNNWTITWSGWFCNGLREID